MLERMYENIGSKLQKVAKGVCVLGIISAGLVFLSMTVLAIKEEEFSVFAVGILYFVIVSLASWVGTFVLYGFAEIVECAELVKKNYTTGESFINDGNNEEYLLHKLQNNREPKPGEWKCPTCGKINANYVGTCGCGQEKG